MPRVSGEIVGGRVGDQESDLLTERGFGFVDHMPTGVSSAAQGRRHARLLGSLAGEDDRDAHRAPDVDWIGLTTNRLRVIGL